MTATVFNCTNDDLTVQAFCFFMRRKGVLTHLTKKEGVPVETIDTNEFTPHIMGGMEPFEAKDRVVFVWREGDSYEMYVFGKSDILSEMRLEFNLRKYKGHQVIYKGLRDIDDHIHFYRKTEHGKPVVSRYFSATPSYN